MSNYGAKRALLGNIVDYAGTFPPAALPLAAAIQKALGFRGRAKHPWLMSKIAAATSDILRLGPHFFFESGADGGPILFAALGSPASRPDDYAEMVRRDFQALAGFSAQNFESSQRSWVGAYETKPAAELPFEVALAALTHSAKSEKFFPTSLFVEVGLGDPALPPPEVAMRSLAKFSQGSLGIKIRTGGPRPPTLPQLSEVIKLASRAGIKFKATQGLHRPVTRNGVYGFVNLFAALAFAYADEALPVDKIGACLSEDDPRAFEFTERHFAWGDLTLTCEQIEAARARHGGCFGSCSIEEPDQFLAEDFPI